MGQRTRGLKGGDLVKGQSGGRALYLSDRVPRREGQISRETAVSPSQGEALGKQPALLGLGSASRTGANVRRVTRPSVLGAAATHDVTQVGSCVPPDRVFPRPGAGPSRAESLHPWAPGHVHRAQGGHRNFWRHISQRFLFRARPEAP